MTRTPYTPGLRRNTRRLLVMRRAVISKWPYIGSALILACLLTVGHLQFLDSVRQYIRF